MRNMPHPGSPSAAPLRVWPGVVLVAAQWLLWLVVPLIAHEASLYAVIGGVGFGALVAAWWLLFSRAPWLERLGALALMIGGVAATSLVVHHSIANGFMGMMLPLYAVPVLSLALVLWAVASRRLAPGPRRVSMAAVILLACGAFTLVRTGGITGEADSDLHWRWTPTPEERLLAMAPGDPPAGVIAPVVPPPAAAPTPTPDAPPPVSSAAGAATRSTAVAESTPDMRPAGREEAEGSAPAPSGNRTGTAVAPRIVTPEWPGFRGPARDSVVRGLQIATDWSETPPMELWRRPIGPGWSSFAVAGDFFYTQEQRGEDEIVACYLLSTGAPVWQHRDAVRFWESNGGAGPRATPTLHGGRVYTMGATGIVNALDAATGAVLWSRNAAADTGKTIPDWGIASSPLAIDDLVIVAVAGQLAAYDAVTGATRWIGETGGGGYSSPHLATIDGVPQVLLLRGARTISVAPADGSLLWEHRWLPAVSIVQPAIAGGNDVLVASGDAMGGLGIRRLTVTRGESGWTVDERWTSRGLKPYFNDFVVHRDHAFGFDGSILSAIELGSGTRMWKGGRYGHGQLMLLPEQDLLLVLSEDGELALVRATADAFTEVARVPALDGKTWNHPVVVGDLLLVRNGEEMAAFRLPHAAVSSERRDRERF